MKLVDRNLRDMGDVHELLLITRDLDFSVISHFIHTIRSVVEGQARMREQRELCVLSVLAYMSGQQQLPILKVTYVTCVIFIFIF